MTTTLEAAAGITETIERKRRENTDAVRADYLALVRKVAGGKKLAPFEQEQAAVLWEALGKDEAKFLADCAEHQRRVKDAAIRAELPALKTRAAEIEAELIARGDKLAEVQRVERAAIDALVVERNAVAARLSAAEQADVRLFNQYRNPDVARDEQELSAALVALRDLRAAKEKTHRDTIHLPLAEARRQLREAEALAPGDRRSAEVAAAKKLIAALEKQVEPAARVLAEIDAEAERLNSLSKGLAELHYTV